MSGTDSARQLQSGDRFWVDGLLVEVRDPKEFTPGQNYELWVQCMVPVREIRTRRTWLASYKTIAKADPAEKSEP